MSFKKYEIDDIYGNLEFPVKGDPCIYFLNDELGNIVYVGQTTNLRSRITSHDNSKDFDSFSFYALEDKQELSNQEALMIVTHDPVYNKTLPKNDLYTTRANAKDQIARVIEEHLTDLDTVYSHINKKENYSIYYIEQNHVDKIKSLVTESLKAL